MVRRVSQNKSESITAYKEVIHKALARCPRGTKSKITKELSKNASYISQITNPEYAIPIPGQYVNKIVNICALNSEEEKQFRHLYAVAHPDKEKKRTRSNNEICIQLPKSMNATERRRVEQAINEIAETIINLVAGNGNLH